MARRENYREACVFVVMKLEGMRHVFSVPVGNQMDKYETELIYRCNGVRIDELAFMSHRRL